MLKKSLVAVSPRLKQLRNPSLRKVLVIPFVLQLVGTVGLVGYFSFRNGQQTVNQMVNQLIDKTNSLVVQELDSYLSTPQQINQANLEAVDLGLLKLQDFEKLGQFFWRQMQIYDVGYINYANEAGEFIGVERIGPNRLLIHETRLPQLNILTTYPTDNKGNRQQGLAESAPDPIQEEGWYADARTARRPIWSQIYQWNDKPEVLSISSSYPVYDRNQKLLGVLGVDLLLSSIGEFLQTINISPNSRIFIVERNGNLVATSSGSSNYRLENGEARRLQATASSDALIRMVAQQIQQERGGFAAITAPQRFNLQFEGETEFVQVMPWQDQAGLSWLVVVAVPEQDFMAQVNANNQTTLLLCAIALLTAILVGILTTRWVMKPILQLNQAAKQIAAGQIAAGQRVESIELDRTDELKELATSFNSMAEQIHTSFAELEKTNRELEDRVTERTASLMATEAELRGLFAAMTELIFVFDRRGTYLKAASTNPDLLYVPIEASQGKTLYDIYPFHEAEHFVGYIRAVLDRQTTLSIEYSLWLHGEEKWFAANISPISAEQVIWVARDISQQKQVDRVLRQKNRELSQTLQQLQTTQAELIQSEKLAALGQLVAGIAHEINTPLGAIRASISNIAAALDLSMQRLPDLFQTLPPDRFRGFFALLALTQQPRKPRSFREERQLRRQLTESLRQRSLPQADRLADSLSKMGLDPDLDGLMGLLQLPNSQFVLETAYQLSVVQNNSQNITLAVERAAKIVFALKNYARQDNSGNWVEAEVKDGIETVLTLYHNLIKRGVEVEKHYAAVPKLLCHPDELTQVWANLIHNALQAMNGQGILGIQVEACDQQIVVRITDSGAGVPADIQPRIFEPFFTTKPIGEGTGLGLDIVQRIVAKHRGRVELQSRPGHTTFSVWLPTTPEQRQTEA
jgi:C4-dicarboxylate-specific signal transduction histidine kinase